MKRSNLATKTPKHENSPIVKLFKLSFGVFWRLGVLVAFFIFLFSEYIQTIIVILKR